MGAFRPSIRTLEIKGICVSGCMGGGGVPEIDVILSGPPVELKRLAGLGEFTPSLTNDAEITITTLRVGGDVGSIRAHSIGLADIDGDVTGSIILNFDPLLFSTGQTVQLIDIGGDLLGDFRTYKTNVDALLVGGQIGTSGAESEIRMTASSSLLRVECQNMEADVEVHGFLGRLAVTGDINGSVVALVIGAGPFTISGAPGLFVGGNITGVVEIGPLVVGSGGTIGLPAIETADLVIGGTVGGDVLLRGAIASDASVTLASLSSGTRLLVGHQPVAFPSVGNAGAITIGSVDPLATIEIIGNLEASGSIEITGLVEGNILIGGSLLGAIGTTSPGSLVGQVIVNADGMDTNESEPNVWTGPVSVGTAPNEITLAPVPFYANRSAYIGGGAVGLVPYGLHSEDCVPPSGSNVSAGTTAPYPQITMRYYGPLAPSNTLGTMLAKVERKRQFCQFGQPCNWEIVTNDFVGSFSSNSGRDLLVTGPFECGYKYRVTPGAGIVCGGSPSLENAQITIDGEMYFIDVFCKTDLTLNGNTGTPDITMWLAEPSDVDGNGVIDPNDLSAVILAIE